MSEIARLAHREASTLVWEDAPQEVLVIKSSINRWVNMDSRDARLAVMAGQLDTVNVGFQHAGVPAEHL